VFTSTLAAGGYGLGEAFGGAVERICRQLLRAAYLGTLLAALSVGKRRVVLTMIGGGVFGNPHKLICECALWAVQEVERMGRGELEVVLNARDLSRGVDRTWLRGECEQRGGVLRSL
jgi:O-acetyl-ADP-ribose deacetylase (regulator of RNase III)